MAPEIIPIPQKNLYTVCIKRLLDVVFSGIGIIVLSPLLLCISFLELIIHGRPVFYRQERPGYHEELFNILKFRTMTNETDAEGNLLPGNQRITKFGRILRKYSLDELPELFTVLSGKMSIIGPRPLLPMSLPHYSPRHHMRHSVRPGLACVPLKPIKTWTWNDQFENDIWYVEHCSFSVDVKMLFAVLREAIAGSDYRVDDTRPEYDGTNLFYDPKSGSDIEKTTVMQVKQ